MATMSNELGHHCIAEGVETDEQLRILRRLGISRVQGYLLGRPAPRDRTHQAAGRGRPGDRRHATPGGTGGRRMNTALADHLAHTDHTGHLLTYGLPSLAILAGVAAMEAGRWLATRRRNRRHHTAIPPRQR